LDTKLSGKKEVISGLANSLNNSQKPITIPNHKIIKPGLLRKAIRDAGISVDEFIELLKK